jgi:hypothetical protein
MNRRFLLGGAAVLSLSGIVGWTALARNEPAITIATVEDVLQTILDNQHEGRDMQATIDSCEAFLRTAKDAGVVTGLVFYLRTRIRDGSPETRIEAGPNYVREVWFKTPPEGEIRKVRTRDAEALGINHASSGSPAIYAFDLRITELR